MAHSATTTEIKRARSRDFGSDAFDPSQNFTKKHHIAASLLADDELTDEAIAAEAGISRRQLATWKQKPEFAALVGDYVGKLQAGMLRLRIAKKRERVKALDNLNTRLFTIIEQRAERYTADVVDAESAVHATRKFFGDSTPAEAATGLMVKQESMNAQGQKMVNWSVDTGLVKSIMDLHKQAATELGQWVEKSASDVTTNMVQIVGIEDDDL